MSSWTRSLPFAAALVLGVSPLMAQDFPPAPPAPYRLQMHTKVPMRDGVKLDATVYRPVGQGAHPVIMMLTPYPGLPIYPSIAYFAAHGYVAVVVDVRGRGDSEGVFDPWNDAQDGYDAVEWLARQSWSNGKVGMIGGSYAGGDQWLTAAARPPHLATIVPTASTRFGVDVPWYHNIFETYQVQWLTLVSGKALRLQAFGDQPMWDSMFDTFFTEKRPYPMIDAYTGDPQPTFHVWLQHPMPDNFRTLRGGDRKDIAAVRIPVLEITGEHDGDQHGALSFHADHEEGAAASGAADYLVIGPWDHEGTRKPKEEVGSDAFGPLNPPQHYGPASVIDVMRLQREWYDHVMKGGPLPAFLKDRVTYYVGGEGAECWKSAPTVAAITRTSMSFYLDASDGAHGLYQSGVLLPSQARAAGGAWVGNPNDVSAGVYSKAGPSERLHGNGLIFHSAPFAQAVELDGRMDLRTWLAMDVPDTDLLVSLYLVTADGKVRLLDQNVMRARYRHGLDHEEAVPLGAPQSYRFDNGGFFALRANPGDRLRLVIGTLNDPSMEKNWNSMKPLRQQTAADARVAHIRLLQDAIHPSTLTMPVGDIGAPCRASANW